MQYPECITRLGFVILGLTNNGVCFCYGLQLHDGVSLTFLYDGQEIKANILGRNSNGYTIYTGSNIEDALQKIIGLYEKLWKIRDYLIKNDYLDPNIVNEYSVGVEGDRLVIILSTRVVYCSLGVTSKGLMFRLSYKGSIQYYKNPEVVINKVINLIAIS